MDRYEEALERAKKGLPIDEVFPELKESDDEKMRKELLEYAKDEIRSYNNMVSGDYDSRDKEDKMMHEWWKKVVAYLEKQKEYISNNFDDVWEREDCSNIIAEGKKLTPEFEALFKKVCHAWYDKGIELEKQKEQKSIEDVVKKITQSKETATKFLKSAGIMNENGELAEMYRSEEQKPAEYPEKGNEYWFGFNEGKGTVLDNPEQFGLYRPAEWSNEEKLLEQAIDWLIIMRDKHALTDEAKKDISRIVSELKSFSERFVLQPKQELSDKDKEMFDRCIANAKKHIPIPDKNGHLAKIEERVDEELVDWLKGRFFNVHWKPSEEQMEALKETAEWKKHSNPQLFSLYNDLKKLM